MTTVFNDWFPTSRHGDPEINVMSFGAIADGTGHPLWALGFTSLRQRPERRWRQRHCLPGGNLDRRLCRLVRHHRGDQGGIYDDGVLHGDLGYKNRPLCFPAGRYIINKPIIINSVSDALIYGTGYWTQIYNENETPGQNTCIRAEGLRYSRIENFSFGAKGVGAIAFDLTNAGGAGRRFQQPRQCLDHL